jgi:hypothetical protein
MGELNDDKKAWSGYFSCSLTRSLKAEEILDTQRKNIDEREKYIHTENRKKKRMNRREYREKYQQ